MAQNTNFDKTLKKTKATLDTLLAQAKESVKVLETLQKEGLTRAATFLNTNLPSKSAAQKLANEKLAAGLKKIGLASRDEVEELEKKVEALASELRAQISKVSRKTTQKSKTDAETESHA
jgi:hypothetical protein